MSGKVCLAQHEGHIFIVLTAMTPGQVRIVQDSFQLVAPYGADAARVFYEELFRIAPEARAMFPEDMSAQKAKLVQMLATVVRSLGNVAAISDHVADLGRRHMAYDVSERHYAFVGQALLLMLRRLLGPNYTEEIQDAWGAAYNMLARMMLEAAANPYPAGNFFGRVVRGVVTSHYGADAVAPEPAQPAAPKPFTAPIKLRSY